MRLRAITVSSLAAVLGAGVVLAGPLTAAAVPGGPPAPAAVPVDPPTIPDSAAMAHAGALAKVAESNGGTRAHGRPGYKASLDYVKAKLDAAGFQTVTQPFNHGGAQGWNLVADWPHGDANNVVFIGAHLDSVTAGAGINDNGSGTAAVLENALQVAQAKLRPDKRMRFGFWGAEEVGLVGSKFYTRSLSADERKKVNVYLNFDMVGTKSNRAWGVYREGPEFNQLFKDWFKAKGLSITTIDPAGRSDHGAFSGVGIKVSGISSEANLNQLEPCYHKSCDNAGNVDGRSLGQGTNAIAAVLWKLAGAKTVR